MAYVHEIKFFQQDSQLHAALFDKPTVFGEFWIKNVLADTIDIKKLLSNLELETKYAVEALGIKPFPASKPLFKFIAYSHQIGTQITSRSGSCQFLVIQISSGEVHRNYPSKSGSYGTFRVFLA